MEGYKGENMPKWVGESCASSLKRLQLVKMENVQHIFTMNTSSSSEIGMVDELFPLLEEVYISNMRNLRELVVSPPSTIPVTTTTTSGVVAFPSLRSMEISNCPKLGALPARLKSLKGVRVEGECCEELLDSIISNHQSSLTSLSLINNERRVLVGGGSSSSADDMDVVLFPLLEQLAIKNMRNLRELVSPPPPIPVTTTTSGVVAFPNLRVIMIDNCPKLGAVPAHLKSLKNVWVEGECCEELLDSIISNHQSSLTSLWLGDMNERRVLVGGGSSSSDDDVDVVLFPLLEKLDIRNMRNLRELVSLPPPIPVTTTTRGVVAFPSLRRINIFNCPKLGALPPRLKSLEDVAIVMDCCDELLESIISNQRNPISLSILWMDERRVLFAGAGGANNNKDEALMNIDDDEDEITRRLAGDNNNDDNNEARLAGGPSTNFQSLWIDGCFNLRCLFDEEECEELATAAGAERERTRRGGLILTNLTGLDIRGFPELRISVEQWRNLITAPSLKELNIKDCPKVVPSKGEEADQVIALLRSLRSRIDRFHVDFLRETGTS